MKRWHTPAVLGVIFAIKFLLMGENTDIILAMICGGTADILRFLESKFDK